MTEVLRSSPCPIIPPIEDEFLDDKLQAVLVPEVHDLLRGNFKKV